MRTFAGLAVPLALAAALSGCAQTPLAVAPQTLFDDRAFAAPRETIDPNAVFAVSEAMRRYLSQDLAAQMILLGRKKGLVDGLYRKGQLRLEYDAGVTRNAAEAFDARAGNCLSLVIMTGAMAHELGLPVHYQLALGDDTWSRNGNLYLAIGHVNLVLGSGRSRFAYEYQDDTLTTIDFLPQEDAARLPVRAISEATVTAMFMNNRAAESLAKGEIDTAYWWARAAIRADPGFLNAYNTLGAIYTRHGNWDDARTALSAALEREPKNPDVMANLIPVLNALGQSAQARALEAQLHAIESQAPFADFNRGVAAMENGQYGLARDLFAREISRQPSYHEFHYWLGIAYLRLGKLDAAREELREAKDNSTTRQDYDLYSAKLERLGTVGQH